MQKWKKFLATLTAGALCAVALPLAKLELPEVVMNASAERSILTYNDLVYTIQNNGTIEIVGYTGTPTNIVIPAEINRRRVVSVGHFAFNSCDSLTEVTISEGITVIKSDAFLYNSSLTKVTFPSSVESIESEAFTGCSQLKTVIMPEGLKSIGRSAFSETAISEVEIPNSVTDVGSFAFSYTPWFTAKQKENPMVIANGILLDGTKCSGDVIIPNGVTSIADEAFERGNLNKIIIPEGVTNIGDGVFENCTDLETISIPSSLTSIGGSAFNGTIWLEEKQKENPLVIINGTLVNGEACSGKVIIPDDVMIIGDDAFYGCSMLKDIVIPNSVISIGDRAFGSCTALENVTISNSVKTIGGEAFSNTAWLNAKSEEVVVVNNILISNMSSSDNVEIPDDVNCIGQRAFASNSLKTVTIPESVTDIEGYAFAYCMNLTDVYYKGTTAQWAAINLDENYWAGIGVDSTGSGNKCLVNATIHCSDGVYDPSASAVSSTGDLDGNGTVDTNDVFEAMLYVAYRGAGMSGGLRAEQITAADIDGDGSVDSTDVYYILYYVALQGAGKKPTWDSVLGR